MKIDMCRQPAVYLASVLYAKRVSEINGPAQILALAFFKRA